MTWVLLIYTVPSEPSRKRAFIWRELKKVGAIYLRDGVCALPERDSTMTALRAIAAKVEEFGGHATLVEAARLATARSEAIIAQLRTNRVAEYAEIAGDAAQFLQHIRHETAHRDFTFGELTDLAQDLGKLKRWVEQVQARDYFGGEAAEGVIGTLARCDEALALFMEAATRQDGRAP